MQYALLRTDTFEKQLSEIIRYIAISSNDANIALSYLNKIEMSVSQLEIFPYKV